jgi:hypothetical protein
MTDVRSLGKGTLGQAYCQTVNKYENHNQAHNQICSRRLYVIEATDKVFSFRNKRESCGLSLLEILACLLSFVFMFSVAVCASEAVQDVKKRIPSLYSKSYITSGHI